MNATESQCGALGSVRNTDWQRGLQNDPRLQPKTEIRQPAVMQALDELEKTIAELGQQWTRCSEKISPIVSPTPCVGEKDCVSPRTPSATAMAERINSIRYQAQNICNNLRETTNQIEI